MKIISNHPVHQDEVNTRGAAIVNGLTFRRDPEFGGRPTATGASERDCLNFVGIPGFGIYHDDNSLSGETRLKTDQEVVGLDAITSALNSGDVTLQQLRSMDLMVPGLGAVNGLIDLALTPLGSRKDALSPTVQEQLDADAARAQERESVPEAPADQSVPVVDLTVEPAPAPDDESVPEVSPQVAPADVAEPAAESPEELATEAQDGPTPDGEPSRADLKAALTERGIPFGPADSRARLLAKLSAGQ